MVDRKAKREARIEKINKLLDKYPSNSLTRNTVKRSLEHIDMEEEKDTALQKMANDMYSPEGTAYLGDEIDPELDLTGMGGNPYIPNIAGMNYRGMSSLGISGGINVPSPESAMFDYQFANRTPNYKPMVSPNKRSTLNNYLTRTDRANPLTPKGNPMYGRNVLNTVMGNTPEGRPDLVAGLHMSNDVGDFTTEPPDPGNPADFTTGDYIGMAGGIGGAIAPFLTSGQANRATQPVINRYKGFGRDALAANATAQSLASRNLGEGLIDVDSGTGAAIGRNRNSAMGVNTQRALDTSTYIGSNRAKNALRNAWVNQMTGLLGQQSGLENVQDQMVAQGQTAADVATQQNVDNYYTQRAQDVAGAFSGAQTLGRDLNTSWSNRMDVNLLRQLSEHGLTYDKYGNLIKAT